MRPILNSLLALAALCATACWASANPVTLVLDDNSTVEADTDNITKAGAWVPAGGEKIFIPHERIAWVSKVQKKETGDGVSVRSIRPSGKFAVTRAVDPGAAEAPAAVENPFALAAAVSKPRSEMDRRIDAAREAMFDAISALLKFLETGQPADCAEGLKLQTLREQAKIRWLLAVARKDLAEHDNDASIADRIHCYEVALAASEESGQEITEGS